MYIQRAPSRYLDSASSVEALERVLSVGITLRRPCQSCKRSCQCGSSSCFCQCSVDCPEAPRALSSEPDRYPIEQGVVPLVFELSRMREVTPCWSCEGHLDNQGSLWKLPQVWFYSSSPVYVELISHYAWELHSSKQLSYPWHVIVLAYGQPGTTTYSLQPDLTFYAEPELSLMQEDIRRLANDIVGNVMMQALKRRQQQPS